jgi:hypothetical protein
VARKSLIDATAALADMTATIDRQLKADRKAIARIESTWGIETPPWRRGLAGGLATVTILTAA